MIPEAAIKSHPPRQWIEEIPIDCFSDPEGFFQRLLWEIDQPKTSVVHYLNIHVANTAWRQPALKQALQKAEVVYCDGAGIALASRWSEAPIPCRLTAADWMMDLLAYFAAQKKRVFLLGGEPGIAESFCQKVEEQVSAHSIVGFHHGHFSVDSTPAVIDKIHSCRPDVLIVGMGTPRQELWIEENRPFLKVPLLYGVGAVMDYYAGKIPRCPGWMGKIGMEWLYRFFAEPRRLWGRYIVGNPWFFSRLLIHTVTKLPAPPLRPQP